MTRPSVPFALRRLAGCGSTAAFLICVAVCASNAAPLIAQVPPVISHTPPLGQAASAPIPPTGPSAPTGPYQITHYDLNLNFNFPDHQLAVEAKITLSAVQPLVSAVFRLNQNMVVDNVTDAFGAALGQQRQAGQVMVGFASPVAPGTALTITLHYHGQLSASALSPISGIRTAYVGPEGAFLLYPGEWFPLGPYGTDRFTANINATLPSSMALVTSGQGATSPAPDNSVLYSFTQEQASFPGTVVVTPLQPKKFTEQGLETSFYFSPDVSADLTQKYAESAGQIYNFLMEHFGTPPVTRLTFVELPNDALPSFSSPDLIVLSRANIGDAVNPNLLVDEIAQQWFGIMVSPATLNDAWLQYGGARFCEALYTEQTAGKSGLQSLVEELEVGALSYPDTPLSNSAQLYPFSPQFQDLNYDKGSLVFHMLRWMVGDQNLFSTLRNFLNANAWKAVNTGQFEQALEEYSKSDLRSFFAEWYRGTAVPDFQASYTIRRLQKGGYSVTGKLEQSLDLFTMPVDLRVETDGATEDRRVDVSGTNAQFSLEVKGRPRKIIVDPDNWILKSNPDLKLRVALSRGDTLVASGDFGGAQTQYQDALQLNPVSSLAHYRVADAYFEQQNWQKAADEYRAALNGDLNPKWVEVWGHIQLGKIFDVTGQRPRALQEYQLAAQTHDDTNGAQELVQQYVRSPYKS